MYRSWVDEEPVPDLDSPKHNPSAKTEPVNDDGLRKPRFPEDPEGPVPFLMLRGRWLRQMGFYVGAQVLVEAMANGVITIRVMGVPGVMVPKVPMAFGREIHYTEVEAHTHLKRSKRGRR